MLRGFGRNPRTGRSAPAGGMTALVLASALVVGVAIFIRPDGRQLVGGAYAVDGDTLRIEQTTIRLKGMDAPEMKQTCLRAALAYPCGRVAREALVDIIRDRPVQCRINGR